MLGLELTSVSFATGFRDDRLSPEDSPNPAFGKAPLGDIDDPQMTGARRRQIAWVEDTIRLPGVSGSFRHTKIRLDDAGNGSCRLGG